MPVPAELLDAVRERAAHEPDSVLPVLALLAAPADSADNAPGEAPGSVASAVASHDLAVEVNRRRLDAAEQRFRSGAWDTAHVRDRLGVSRQAVNERVRAGRLLAAKVGSRFAYPGWQFSGSGLVTGLPEVLRALRPVVGTDARAADAVMRAPQPDLPDRMTLAELLAVGAVDDVVQRLTIRAEQS